MKEEDKLLEFIIFCVESLFISEKLTIFALKRVNEINK